MSARSSVLTQDLRREERTIEGIGALASKAEMMAVISRRSAIDT